MKQRKLTFLLLAGALGVWGFVIFRLVTPSETTMPSQLKGTEERTSASEVRKISSFIIVANYRDPFIPTYTPPRGKKKKVSISPKAIITKKPVDWSFVRYIGMVRNQKRHGVRAILSIHGKDRLAEPGKLDNGLELLSVEKDSVLIRYQNEDRFIKLTL